MKRIFACICALVVTVSLWGCTSGEPEGSTADTGAAPVPEVAGTWQEIDGVLYYTDENGLPLTGWQDIGGSRYCFRSDGSAITGWLNDEGRRYYLDSDGCLLTGWQDLEGKRFYFGTDGAMTVGWLDLAEGSYYFGIDGAMITGLMNIEGRGYYFAEDGRRYSGWLTQEDKTYYFGADGVMAVGPANIDGQAHYFNPRGIHILLVNPWNPLPEDYVPELVGVTDGYLMEASAADALMQMLQACEAAGYEPMIVSAYRTQEDQIFLYERKVKYYLDRDWEQEAAEKEAAKSVAVPGTSEHQLGLAVDLVDEDYMYLDDGQARTDTQKWLMEHCHEFGFILRYPVGSTEITGIIYEPWHYRYVGVEIAQEITNLGITLEEYLGAA